MKLTNYGAPDPHCSRCAKLLGAYNITMIWRTPEGEVLCDLCELCVAHFIRSCNNGVVNTREYFQHLSDGRKLANTATEGRA